jgi:hypothetical protein
MNPVFVGNLIVLAVFAAILGIAFYGAAYMVGGPRAANGLAKGTRRAAERGVRGVGRGTGRLAMRYPLVAGIIVLVLVLSRC